MFDTLCTLLLSVMVGTMASIMSSTGNSEVGQPQPCLF